MAAVTLVPCACGCGRVVLPIRAHRFATEACRLAGDRPQGRCVRCHRPKTPEDGTFKCCTKCRQRGRVKAKRDRETPRPALAPAMDIEAVFAATKARLRREWHVDGWSQRMPYGQFIDA